MCRQRKGEIRLFRSLDRCESRYRRRCGRWRSHPNYPRCLVLLSRSQTAAEEEGKRSSSRHCSCWYPAQRRSQSEAPLFHVLTCNPTIALSNATWANLSTDPSNELWTTDVMDVRSTGSAWTYEHLERQHPSISGCKLGLTTRIHTRDGCVCNSDSSAVTNAGAT